MKNLSELQNNFVDAIYDKSKKQILSSIKNGNAPKEELFEIYRNNLEGALINALIITYPEVFKFAKEKKFKEFCLKLIKQNRSQSGNLDDYGGNFSEILLQEKENFLSDLANLEWFKHRSYLAADQNLLDIEKLKMLSSEKLFDVKFKLHSSCFLYSSNYNLLAKAKQTKPQKKLIYFVIFRHNLDIFLEKISKNEYDFLSGIKDGLSLYQIYEKYDINIQFCLSKYLSNSVLAEFTV